VSDTRPRRTFAVISHPDAGKSTLTEALALHARVITEAGAVHGKGDRRATVSDWMAMEKARGISITSAALQFVYRDHVINLVDTPGHSDFSEDTYRVLSAVDSAVMLVDAGKGLEPQTLKLFKVCALRGIPVLTVINKWDRPGLSALELMDLIQEKIKLRPTPLTWPVGEAGDFRGVLDRRTGEFVKYTRTAGGATRAPSSSAATWPAPSTPSPPGCARASSAPPRHWPGATSRSSRRPTATAPGWSAASASPSTPCCPHAPSTRPWPGSTGRFTRCPTPAPAVPSPSSATRTPGNPR
jgi:peptide chain release factor 3